MAFRTATKPTAVENNGFKKATAFINHSLPILKDDGSDGVMKVDPVKLYEDQPAQADLIEMWQKDPVATEAWYRANLVIDFRMAGTNTGTRLKI